MTPLEPVEVPPGESEAHALGPLDANAGPGEGTDPAARSARSFPPAPRTDPEPPRTDPEPPRTDPEFPGAGGPEGEAQAAPDPYIGTVIAGRYIIERKLGEGGMGAVYLAVHKDIERKVAIKILAQDFARKPDLVARFLQEARAAARIGHENIVEVYDFGETESRSVFFAMEYLVGQDLAHVIRTEAPLPVPRVRHIALQICKALGAAHQKQIIHRDLKPENVFLVEREGRSDFVKVLDFGIAKFSNIEEEKSRLTRTGMIFGTPEYMSPEQARGDAPDLRVDIYALGCILYEMLTGSVPFSAETFMGVLTKHMFEPLEPPSRRCGRPLPREMEEVVLRALEKDRDRRFQTMAELAQALEGEAPTFPSGPVPAALPPSATSQRLVPPASGAPEGVPALAATSPLPMTPPLLPAAPLAAGVPPQGLYPQAVPLGYHPHAPAVAPPHPADRTARSSLPGRRRLAMFVGAVAGLGILGVVLLLLGQPAPQPVASPSAPVAVEPRATEPPVPTPAIRKAPPPVQREAPPQGPATLVLSGTPGAKVELMGQDRGEIPHRGALRLAVDLKQAPELRALLVVRKRDHLDESREVVLSAGRETVQEVNLRRRRPPREQVAKPTVDEPRQEPQAPMDKSLRNPFLKSP